MHSIKLVNHARYVDVQNFLLMRLKFFFSSTAQGFYIVITRSSQHDICLFFINHFGQRMESGTFT